jgi:uncharacterized phage-associated protein
MTTARVVAQYLLCKSDPEVGDFISNLKLQKLIYYAQGFHLALHDEKLFEDKILAWEHGPVVESLYHEYKTSGSSALPIPEGFDDSVLDFETKELLDEVYLVYGQFSAWKLRNMTHSEEPWCRTERNAEIRPELMRSFFKKQLL